MKVIFEKILKLAKPYLNTRKNDIHTEIAINYAFQLLKKEDGNKDVVIPAIILHDVGWIKIPKKLQRKAFGPKSHSPELNRIHELEGVKIAKAILEKVSYDKKYTKEILEIIEEHDSRKFSISLNDKITKDADKLWRYSKKGFYIDMKRFEESFEEILSRLKLKIDKWFFTNTAKQIARKEIEKRIKEAKKK